MILKIARITALTLSIFMFGMNLYEAKNNYNLKQIHLSDDFYWQSVDDFVIDNKIEKKQVYGTGIAFGVNQRTIIIAGKLKVVFQIKRNSYRTVW